MEPISNSPSVEHRKKLNFSDSFRFFIIKTPETFSTVSPFLIEKAFTSSIGEVKTIRKMRSGDLFLEASSAKQATALINLQKLAHLDVTVAPHATLNFREARITIRRDGQVLNTKHLILTFNTPDLPQTVKMAYLRCPVRPYIPNPLRCFQCQRFGHSKTVCRGQPTCSRCAEVGHDSADCKAKERCVNCKGDHSSFSRSCPTWLLEKEITAIKIKIKFRIRRLGVLYRHARQFLEKAMRRRPAKTYVSTAIQVDASTAPTSAIAASMTPKNVAVDTLKSVSLHDVKKNRKTRIKESGVQSHKKKGRTSLKNSMTWETMSWTFTPRKATKV
ncbi:uncharacterized protein TNCV_2917111 [Trichonephila clavipes]|nr:uncharacterized protein TNCV_2917111 [Trichonephila clavipes]